MSIKVTRNAAKWYIQELDLQKGDSIQFYMQIYGGIKTNHPNYYLGLSKGKNVNSAYECIIEGITFYIAEEDRWILEGLDLKVSIKNGQVVFTFMDKE